ncbi:hypothetical protein [Aureispira anguillae]|uniref:Uncharacterized protein n=1 Tax=Aureispira anguillae TaxID=2864201 RepID=A0A915YBP8_9BACT|nr:hypothetical protein [Aureispira anguillae]BDS10133.1 hypothetical protein AsAng_0008410 [Aureispira anguillae]
MKIPWRMLHGWYRTGDYVKENLTVLESGSLEEQKNALYRIELEVEHQGGITYLTPFAVGALIKILKEEKTLVYKRLEQFLKELDEVVIEYFEHFEDSKIYHEGKHRYNFQTLLDFFKKYPDEEGENSIWETEDGEGLIMANVITKYLIEDYCKTKTDPSI